MANDWLALDNCRSGIGRAKSMKKTVELHQKDGYYHPKSDDLKCTARRHRCEGRLELLEAFFDGPPNTWFVRLVNPQKDDEQTLKSALGITHLGNYHWRFVEKEPALKKFEQILALPKYAAEARRAQEQRDKKRERIAAMIREGKMRSRPPIGVQA